ncbi:MAG: isopentenyl-diphosphate Delta-isomerase [Pseudomonadota bacterium]|nr:isopentenyl-diphosphate Delta-isomerase [Pseudomonadota bacterium]
MDNSILTRDIQEKLILVDEEDKEIGSVDKLESHIGDGLLHRAFSIFLFDPDGKLLIQKRSPTKMLWPMYWSNSCCSHPRSEESTNKAANRRIQEELGVKTNLKFLYKFIYRAKYEDVGTEYENCWVYVGNFNGFVDINTDEISDYRFLSPSQLTNDMQANPEIYSPWFKLEWKHICKNFQNELPGRN